MYKVKETEKIISLSEYSMFKSLLKVLQVLKESCKSWFKHEPFVNSALISYYAIFSLPGLLVISINLAAFFFDQDVVTEKVTRQIDAMIGRDSAENIKQIINNVSETDARGLPLVLGICVLLFGASGVFYHIQQILNKLWEVRLAKNANILQVVIDRLFSFGLVVSMGFLLLVSLLLSTALSAFSEWIMRYFSESIHLVFQFVDYQLSFGVVVIIFASIYRFLPDADIKWKYVWIGSTFTAILFTFAKFIISLYFGYSNPGSTYGAAGSIVLIMLWVTYVSLILIFGAEFTKNYADTFEGRVKPSEHAKKDHGARVRK